MSGFAKSSIADHDHVRKKLRNYYLDKKEASGKRKIDVLVLNVMRRRNGKKEITVPTIYTVHHFAKDLGCNPATLRKIISGNGVVSPELLASFNSIVEPDADTLVLKMIDSSKIGFCCWIVNGTKCNEEFIRWAHNRKYCDQHSRSIKREKSKC